MHSPGLAPDPLSAHYLSETWLTGKGAELGQYQPGSLRLKQELFPPLHHTDSGWQGCHRAWGCISPGPLPLGDAGCWKRDGG